jgi:hypothetical protein
VADGDGLENHCESDLTVGSNPTPSAFDLGKLLAEQGAELSPAGTPRSLELVSENGLEMLTGLAGPAGGRGCSRLSLVAGE